MGFFNFKLITNSLNLSQCLHLAINSLLSFNNFFGSGKSKMCIFSSKHRLHLLSKDFGVFDLFNMDHWISRVKPLFFKPQKCLDRAVWFFKCSSEKENISESYHMDHTLHLSITHTHTHSLSLSLSIYIYIYIWKGHICVLISVCACVCVCVCAREEKRERERESVCVCLFTDHSARAACDKRSIFKRSLTGLNSKFSFS